MSASAADRVEPEGHGPRPWPCLRGQSAAVNSASRGTEAEGEARHREQPGSSRASASSRRSVRAERLPGGVTLGSYRQFGPARDTVRVRCSTSRLRFRQDRSGAFWRRVLSPANWRSCGYIGTTKPDSCICSRGEAAVQAGRSAVLQVVCRGNIRRQLGGRDDSIPGPENA
jgi:hypothetical protein